MAGLLLKPAGNSSAANVHAMRNGTLPWLTVSRLSAVQATPWWAAARLRSALIPRAGAGVQPLRVSPLPRVPAKTPNWLDSGRSAVSAGTSLHARFRPSPTPTLKQFFDSAEKVYLDAQDLI